MPDQQEIKATNRKYVSSTFPNSDPYYSTIQAAVNSIPVNSSGYPDQPWTVFVYPGIYSESITLKSNISIVGDRNQSTIIKGNGTNPTITGPATDGGVGQCFICNMTIDGNNRSAIAFPDASYQKTNFVTDVQLLDTNWGLNHSDAPAVSIGNNQNLNCFNLHCIIVDDPTNYVLFTYGFMLSGNSNLGIWQSQVATSSQCLVHQSSQYIQAYDCIFQSASTSMQINAGTVNLDNCQTIGGIFASGSSTRVKHRDSFHDGTLSVDSGATMWVTGMKWGERPGIDVLFILSGNSKMIVTNSKAGVTGGVSYVVLVNSTDAIFKAYNSEFISLGSGATITGVPNATVYLYHCVLNKNVDTVTVSPDSNFKVTVNAE